MKIWICLLGFSFIVIGGFALSLPLAGLGIILFIGGIFMKRKSKRKQQQEQWAYENLIKKGVNR